MKRVLLLLVLYSSVAIANFSQPIGLSLEKHLPQQGDTLLLVEIPHLPFAISTGADCVWDFSNMITDSIELDTYYYSVAHDSTRITQHLMRTHHQYEIVADTIWCVGFENASVSVNYTRKRKAIAFPFAYGDSLISDFAGVSKYAHKKTCPIVGNSRVYAEAWGKLILPSLTLDTTLLIHSRHIYQNYLADSVCLIEDIFQWYDPSYRYPVFELAYKYSNHQPNNPTISHAFYHIPTAETLRSNDNTDRQFKTCEEITFAEIDSILTNIRFYPNPVHDNLTITYKQKQQAEMFFSVHYSDGFCVYQSPIRSQNEGEYSEYIPMTMLPIGSYVLYIHVDDKVVATSILKN